MILLVMLIAASRGEPLVGPNQLARRESDLGRGSRREALRVRAGADQQAVARANALYRRLLDSVGLYTLIGDLKPMSDISLSSPRVQLFTPEEERRLRPECDAVLAVVESDLIKTRVIWRKRNEGYQRLIWVLRTDLVRGKIEAHAATFARERVTPRTAPAILLDRLETLQFRDLHRIQGLLYGFPEYAVNFFCRRVPPGTPIGIGKDRRAVTIPAYGVNAFIYVIPIDNELAEQDREIERKAAAILREYKQRRPRFALPGGEIDAIRLINEWYSEQALPAARP